MDVSENITSLDGLSVSDLSAFVSNLNSSFDPGNITTVWGSVYPVGMIDLVSQLNAILALLCVLAFFQIMSAIVIVYYILAKRLGVGFT